ncbi:hypothetical protein R3P38DRAFT_415535 [Favolaschia claudopus]|uniref:Uncharacterized protein n=1 Tax=Favolaschia claudopus TaxID=2862362 RepID=A0AAV9ZHM9_9AGAR
MVRCVTSDPNTVTRTCCDTVGSTATFVNKTCGCPYNDVFTADRFMQFVNCSMAHDVVSMCQNGSHSDPSFDTGAALDSRLRWNSAVIVLAVALVCGAVGIFWHGQTGQARACSDKDDCIFFVESSSLPSSQYRKCGSELEATRAG